MTASTPEVVWADTAGIPADDRGLAYGDGVFETIRIRGGQPELPGAHLARLLKGARVLAIPVTGAFLEKTLADALKRFARDDGVLKLILTRGTGGRGYMPPAQPSPRLVVSVHPLPALPSRDGVSASVAAIPLTVNPWLAGLKTLNRLEQVMASAAMPGDCYEAIMGDTDGWLVEGTRSNLLVAYENGWIMPPAASQAVSGVMQGYLVEQLRGRGETVSERPLCRSLLTDSRCGGLLLLNSVIGAVPVHTLAGLRLPMSARLATICGLADRLEPNH